jgi:hypothetical protein
LILTANLTMNRIRASVTMLAAMISLAACGGGPSEPGAPQLALRQIVATPHYVFHAAPGDTVDSEWQEEYHAWMTTALEIESAPRIEYFKYRDVSHLRAITGHTAGTGFTETHAPRVHTIWPIDNHEVVHAVVIMTIGHPPALFNEGVAVAHQTFPDRGRFTPTWNGADLHQLARGYINTNRLPALTALLRGTDFFAHDGNITYPCAGSFVRYLIDTYGLAPFKAYVASARFNDVGSVTLTRFREAYGRPLDDIWNEWRTWLTS